MTISPTTWDGQVRSLALVAGRTVGLVSAETPIPLGVYTVRLTWNGNSVVCGLSAEGDEAR